MNGTAQLNAPQKAGVQAKAAPAGKKVNTNFLELVVASMTNRLHKSKIGLMNESFNPLWNISARQAQQIYDFARTGNYAQIQRLYDEIERCDPTFLVCTTRRCSAMSVLDWRIVESDERPMRRELKKLGDSVKNLREEQIACLEESMSKIDNLPDALEHFALAAFRGYSLVNTWRNVSGDPIHLECLDHWNICLDRRNREWLWNKDGISYMNPSKDNKQMQVIPKTDMVAVVRKRQIDWPAMQIFLRNSVGERDWGRFLETYGLPPVIITMPEFTSDKESAAYMAAAEQVFEGRSGVVPYGSQVNYASESRGTDPFSAFIEHQMKLFVLLATGGTLTSLAESGSGTLAGNAQMKVWEQIIFSDRRITSNAINKQLCEQILKENFKGKPILAEFQLYNKPDFTPDELADLAGKFSSAGFEMDADELTQATGFKIVKKVEETPSDPFGGDLPPPPMQTDRGDDPDPALDPADAPSPTDVTTPVATNVDAGATGPTGPTNTPGPKGPDGLPSPAGAVAPTDPQANNPPTPAPSAPAASQARQDAASRLVRSLQQDFRPVADELAKVLALPEDQRRGAATALLGKLNGLVSDDPVMADVIYDQMQEAFGIQIAKHPDGSVPAANKAVPNAKVQQTDEQDEWQIVSVDIVDADGKVLNAEGECESTRPEGCTRHHTGIYAEGANKDKQDKVVDLANGKGTESVEIDRPEGLERPVRTRTQDAQHIKTRRDGQRQKRIDEAEKSGDAEAIKRAKEMPTGEDVLRMMVAESGSGRLENRHTIEKQNREYADIVTKHLKIGIARQTKGRKARQEGSDFNTITAFPPDEGFVGKR